MFKLYSLVLFSMLFSFCIAVGDGKCFYLHDTSVVPKLRIITCINFSW